jgi:signal transduction histidine kinase
VPVRAELEAVAVPKNVELTLYRAAQEALTNIGKYAHCSQVRVTMRCTGPWVRLTVHDDGRGFLLAKISHGHHGLLGMRVRLESHGGRLVVDSAPGRGTTLTAEVPADKALG